MKTPLFFLLLGLFLPGLAQAHSFQQGAIRIGHLHTTPAETGSRIEVYGPLLNTGATPDRLTGAASDLADQVMIENGAGTALPGIDLRPEQPVSLRPQGMRLALTGLRRGLQPGEMVPLTLTFALAGVARVKVMVEPLPTAP